MKHTILKPLQHHEIVEIGVVYIRIFKSFENIVIEPVIIDVIDIEERTGAMFCRVREVCNIDVTHIEINQLKEQLFREVNQ